MHTRTFRRSLTKAAALAVALVLSLASAQVDAKARALLEGLAPVTTDELRNLDQTLTTTMYLEDGQVVETTAHFVIDFENRRLLMATEIAPGMATNLVLKDGAVTMTVAGMPFKLPAPPESVAQLEQTFEQSEPIMFKDGDVATYDGVVSYADIVSGEQVTYTTSGEGGESTTVQYLFQDGRVVAMHMPLDSGAALVVFDEPVDSQALAGFDSTTYLLENGAWRRFSTARVDSIAYNVELDASLFD